MEKTVIKKKLLDSLSIVIPVVYIILIFIRTITRIPFYDEAHSFLISQFDFGQIFHLTRIEGHPMLWFILVKITSLSEKFYPYPLLILNWIIASCLTLFFWFKFPFNILEKTLIIFSFPFFSYFSIVARPYELTILSLFLLFYYFNKNRPILFSILLIFALNTTVMGMIAAAAFGLMFLYKLIKEKTVTKKQIIIIFLLFILECLLFALQFYSVKRPYEAVDFVYMHKFKTEFITYTMLPFLKLGIENISQTLFKISAFVLIWYSLILFYKKSKEAFFYFLFSNVTLTVFFLVIYIGATWHYFFYFINYIIALALCYKKINDKKIYKLIYTIVLLLLLNPHSMFTYGKILDLNTSFYPSIVKDIIEFEKTHRGRYYCFDFYQPTTGIFPYLKNLGFIIYDLKNNSRYSYDSIASFFELKAVRGNADEISKAIINSSEKNNYVIGFALENPQTMSMKGEKCEAKFNLEFFDKKAKFAIYKITAVCDE